MALFIWLRTEELIEVVVGTLRYLLTFWEVKKRERYDTVTIWSDKFNQSINWNKKVVSQ